MLPVVVTESWNVLPVTACQKTLLLAMWNHYWKAFLVAEGISSGEITSLPLVPLKTLWNEAGFVTLILLPVIALREWSIAGHLSTWMGRLDLYKPISNSSWYPPRQPLSLSLSFSSRGPTDHKSLAHSLVVCRGDTPISAGGERRAVKIPFSNFHVNNADAFDFIVKMLMYAGCMWLQC